MQHLEKDLFGYITNNDNGFHELCLLMVTCRQIDQVNNSKLKNTRNNFTYHCIVRALHDELMHKSRLAILHPFQVFFDGTASRPYGDANLQALDHFIQDKIMIVLNLMCTV